MAARGSAKGDNRHLVVIGGFTVKTERARRRLYRSISDPLPRAQSTGYTHGANSGPELC